MEKQPASTVIIIQVQKHFVKKWGRVGLEEHVH